MPAPGPRLIAHGHHSRLALDAKRFRYLRGGMLKILTKA
jgi:hypothetical protein